MLILPDNEMHMFQIRRMVILIEEEKRKTKAEKVLKQTYEEVLKTWSSLLSSGIDDSYLYNYKNELEYKVFLNKNRKE